ncbi:MAG: hypothetical protein ABIP90_11815 [Vicinamibacterales bacterium]
MRTFARLVTLFLLAIASLSAPLSAGLAPAFGPSFSSIGPLTFAPDGTLFAADRAAASIVALNLGAQASGKVAGTKDVDAVDTKIAALLGTDAAGITITDLAVHPTSKNSFIAVMRGTGPTAQPALVRVDGAGDISLVAFDAVAFTTVALPNAPAASATGRNGRAQSVTDLAFVNGRLYVAGLSNEEFASKLWSVGYPFASVDNGASIEIYHGNHGGFETRAPVMTFVPFTIGNELNILAGYTCTPLVKIPVQALKAGTKVVGTTIAEFGAGNQPLDLLVYRKGGRDFLLMSNSKHGVIKIGTDGFASATPITARVGGTAGVPFESIAAMVNVEQMDLLDAGRTMVISRGAAGRNLTAVVLP